MRKMKNVKTGKIINVVEHIIIKNNCREYYVTNKHYAEDDSVEILAYGSDVELSTVVLSEVKSQLGFRTKNLKELQPAPGWQWIK